MVHRPLPRRGFPLNCAQYNRGRRCGFGRETGEICINSDPCGEKRKKLKKCKEKGEGKAQKSAKFCRCSASQGKSKLAPPESSIPGRHRLASASLLRRQTQAYQVCAAGESQIGRIQRSSCPSPGTDCLELRRKPGRKQVDAVGKFHSGAAQACFGVAAAAPNPGIPILRRKREADWPDSEKLLAFIKE